MQNSTPKLFLAVIVSTAVVLGTVQSTQAAVITYIGADPGATSTSPRPISDAAAASFAAAAGSTTLVTFEGLPLGPFTNLTIAPGVTINGADLVGNPQTIRNSPLSTPEELYGYNTTPGGSEFVSLFGGSLTFSFASPVQAFGAYVIGEQTNLAQARITFNDGTTQSIGIPGSGAGGVDFIGFTNVGTSISSVTFTPGNDIVGVDDVRFSANVSPAPEPSGVLLLGTLLAGTGLWRRRRGSPRSVGE